MTVETRYFRDDEKLGTTNTTTGDVRYIIPNAGQDYIGIMVYVSDVCISGAVPVARVDIWSIPSERDGVWVCPNQSNAGIIKVEVYACNYDGSSPQLIETFVTLDSVKLDAATWTVHYWCFRYYEYPDFYIDFYYGQSGQASRITNFTWSSFAPPSIGVGMQSSAILLAVIGLHGIKKRKRKRRVATLIS